MADRFQLCLAETLRWEGSYSDDLHDPGGKTMRGIIQREYDAYRRSQGQPLQWVKLISDTEVRDIYRNSYWLPTRAGELFAGLDLEVFDYGVNSGPVTAIKHLQQCLGIVPDGHIGTQTIDAAANINDREALIAKYLERRRQYLKSLRTFPYFGRGWMSRCDGISIAAAAACRGNNVHPIDAAFADAPVPHPDPDIQSASQGRSPPEKSSPPVATEATLTLGGVGGLGTAIPAVFQRVGASGQLTASGLLLALLSEPLAYVAAAALFGAVTTYLWRRKHA